jgi:hypothetical protein
VQCSVTNERFLRGPFRCSARNQLLARSGLAADQHRGVGVGHLADDAQQLEHPRMRREDARKIVARMQRVLQLAVTLAQPVALQRALDA